MVNKFGAGGNGKRGPAGPPGVQGPSGKKGSQGERGEQGVIGPSGADGRQGDTGKKGETGEPGPSGADGRQGDTGEPGPSGADGRQGETGEPGPTGEKGKQGTEGGPGEKGEIGTKGDPGIKGGPGPRGAKGERGKDSFDVKTWFPNQMLQWFRNSEACSFYFETEADGLIRNGSGTVIGLKNHSGKNNAVSVKKFERLVKLPLGGYALEFSSSLYRVQEVDIAYAKPSIAALCVSFKMMSYPVERQYMISSNKKQRGLTVEANKLQIWGAVEEPIEILYELGKWNTFFVQYSNISDKKGFFIFDGKRGEFTTKECTLDPGEVYIGGKATQDFFFKGAIAILEVYFRDLEGRVDNYQLPTELCDLVIQNHKFRCS